MHLQGHRRVLVVNIVYLRSDWMLYNTAIVVSITHTPMTLGESQSLRLSGHVTRRWREGPSRAVLAVIAGLPISRLNVRSVHIRRRSCCFIRLLSLSVCLLLNASSVTAPALDAQILGVGASVRVQKGGNAHSTEAPSQQ